MMTQNDPDFNSKEEHVGIMKRGVYATMEGNLSLWNAIKEVL